MMNNGFVLTRKGFKAAVVKLGEAGAAEVLLQTLNMFHRANVKVSPVSGLSTGCCH